MLKQMKRKRSKRPTPKKLEQERKIKRYQFLKYNFTTIISQIIVAYLPTLLFLLSHTRAHAHREQRGISWHEGRKGRNESRDGIGQPRAMSERTKPLSSMQGLKRKRIFGHANGDEEEKLVGKRERERGGKDGKNKEGTKRFRAISRPMNMHEGRFRRLTVRGKIKIEQ